MKVSGGLKEDGISVGNAYDKYNSGNPIVRWMMQWFAQDLSNLVNLASPTTIHEVGCGEGYWTLKWTQEGMAARGSDFSSQVIELAKQNAESRKLSPELLQVRLEERRVGKGCVSTCKSWCLSII